MPSLSCRDVDVACDWFYRSETAIDLMVQSLMHVEDVHPDYAKELISTLGPSSIMEIQLNQMRE